MTGSPATTGRVLIVDDTESNRYVLSAWLRRAGHDVVEAKSGAEGLAVAATQRIDLVVLDVNLPDMSGYAVCELLKADQQTAAIPVLHVSTTAVQAADRTEGLRRGADGYLVEPVEREVLVATVEALMRGAAAHSTAARLAQRLRQLNDATLAVHEASSVDRLVTTIAREATVLFEADAVAVVVIDEHGMKAAASRGAEPALQTVGAELVDAVRKAVGGATSVAASSLPAVLGATPGAAYLAAPLNDPGGHRGVLLVERRESAGDESEVVLTQYARAASTAIRNVRSYDVERRIALALQQNLLPDAVPLIPGIEVAARYEASAANAEVGGDFYEIFTLSDDRVALAIGDVVGHSLEAAMVMAQLRTAIRSYLLEGHGPSATLDRLNRLLRRFHPDVTATACCAVYDRVTGRCQLANAGHLAPLVVSGDDVRYLPYGGPLLGIDVPGAEAHSFTLGFGDVLLLFTDGLVERRGEPIDDGLARLANALRHPAGSLNELCDRVLRDVGPASIMDDIALVAIRPTR